MSRSSQAKIDFAGPVRVDVVDRLVSANANKVISSFQPCFRCAWVCTDDAGVDVVENYCVLMAFVRYAFVIYLAKCGPW